MRQPKGEKTNSKRTVMWPQYSEETEGVTKTVYLATAGDTISTQKSPERFLTHQQKKKKKNQEKKPHEKVKTAHSEGPKNIPSKQVTGKPANPS